MRPASARAGCGSRSSPARRCFWRPALQGSAWRQFLRLSRGLRQADHLFIEAFMVLTIAATLPMLVAGPPPGRPAVGA